MLLVCLSNFGLEYHNVDEIPSRITSSDQCKLTGLGKGEGMDGRRTCKKMTDSSFGLRSMNFSFHPSLDRQSQRVEWPTNISLANFLSQQWYKSEDAMGSRLLDGKRSLLWHLFFLSPSPPLQDITMLCGCGKAERESWREGHNNRKFERDEWPGLISYRGQSGHFAPTHFRQIERWPV